MRPARIKPHAKEHTNNPVQKPNFRGQAAGDVEVTMELWSSLLIHHLHRRHESTFADPAGCSP